MKKILLFVMILVSGWLQAQKPTLYIQLVSHNEPTDNLQQPFNYAKAKTNMLEMAKIVDSFNVKWNVQSSDGFVFGARTDQKNTSTNIFKTLATAPYADNIEIDPRSKNLNGQNIADQWYIIDSLGGKPSHHLGGCIYSTTNSNIMPIDWEQYRQPIVGTVHGNSWQCDLITGAGSYPPHQNDLNDFGCFKPDSPSNFYSHNPNQNLWCIGVGCAPVLDSLSDENAVIELIKGQVDSIQKGLWPADKFYVTRIMTNQREYGPLYFSKIRKVLDSLSKISSVELKWATLGESFTAFNQWQQSSGKDYSMWLCGETVNGVEELTTQSFQLYPNPANENITIQFNDLVEHEVVLKDITGKIISEQNVISSKQIELNVKSGIYFVQVDVAQSMKVVKE